MKNVKEARVTWSAVAFELRSSWFCIGKINKQLYLIEGVMENPIGETSTSSLECLDTESSPTGEMESTTEQPEEEDEEEVKDVAFDGVFDDLEVDDIYADLKVDSLNDMNYTELKEKYDHSLAEVKETRKENLVLKRENLILKKNISALYLTARREIKRKDKEIKSLNERAMQQRVGSNRGAMVDQKMKNECQTRKEADDKGKCGISKSVRKTNEWNDRGKVGMSKSDDKGKVGMSELDRKSNEWDDRGRYEMSSSDRKTNEWENRGKHGISIPDKKDNERGKKGKFEIPRSDRRDNETFQSRKRKRH